MSSTFKSLLTGALLATRIIASPVLTEERSTNLTIRADADKYYTKVDLADEKIQYGTVDVAKAFKQALTDACTDSQGGCDSQIESLKVATSIWSESEKTAKDAHLTFVPETTLWVEDAIAGHYVDAAGGVGASIQTSDHYKWVTPVVCTGSVCPTESHEGDFFKGPRTVKITRLLKEDDTLYDAFFVSVSVDIDVTEKEVWCTLDKAAGAVAGAFSGALSAVFGVAGLACGG